MNVKVKVLLLITSPIWVPAFIVIGVIGVIAAVIVGIGYVIDASYLIRRAK